MAGVDIVNVTKRFEVGGDGPPAVSNLTLNVRDGEFLVLLGPSGCGKTTTLRMVAGLEKPTEGEIYIGERPVSRLSPGERDIAFVFQFYALYPHLSVRDNISFPLRAQRTPQAEVNRRVSDIAHKLRIEHVLNSRPNRLPSGEQQRVALGRAMVRQPQVFLMDEPLTNLDASLRSDMRVELKHLQQELGTTMLYVTHDQTEAMSMSHRIAVMNLGILQQVGTPLEIYNQPRTLFVATFIGSPPINRVVCRLHDDVVLRGEGSGFRLPLDPAFAMSHSLNTGQALIVGVRSESIQMVDPDEKNDMHGVVSVREPLGDETVYEVDIEGTSLFVKTSPRQVVDVGAKVGLVIDRERTHLFDAESGDSLLHKPGKD
jgi:ABC-type sugar transport system ATPase subunit